MPGLARDVLELTVTDRSHGHCAATYTSIRIAHPRGGFLDSGVPREAFFPNGFSFCEGYLADLLDRFAKYWLNRESLAVGAQVADCVGLRLRCLGGSVEDTSKDNGLAGLKVMVIDDSKTIRRTAETLLKKEGCDVVTATDGFEALAKISDQQPHIIFVDIMMPRLDGYQTCALIKNNQMFKATPVIMLSSKDGLFDKARGRIVGSEQYLTKPFTREELLGAIRRHVAHK
jgi:twitching motility two-component system response regulator PilG